MKNYRQKLKPLELTLSEKFKSRLANGQISGTTWDAKHLDSFLQKNNPNYKMEYLEKKRQLLDYKNQTLLSAGTSKSKESCIFRSKPRFSELPSGYSLNNFPQFFSDINNFAISPQTTQTRDNLLPSIEAAYDQQLRKKNFDESKLEPVKSPSKSLGTSKNKRVELSELKNNRREYSKWKTELANLTKKRRILNNSFRSGALNVDNPLNETTFYYNDLSHELRKKHQSFQIKEDKHKIYIEDHIKTTENIGFDNRNAWNRIKSTNAEFDEKKKKNVDDFWKVKKKNSRCTLRNKLTNERIFGNDENNKNLLDRAVFLREMETRNKTYNIVSLNYYQPEIKPECFKKNRDKRNLDFFLKS